MCVVRDGVKMMLHVTVIHLKPKGHSGSLVFFWDACFLANVEDKNQELMEKR